MGEDKKGKRKKWPIVVIVILAVLIGGVSAAWSFAQSKLNKISRNETKETVKPEDEYFETNEEEEDDSHETMNPDDLKWPEGGDIMENKDIMNIMLIGQDKRPRENRARSDSHGQQTGSESEDHVPYEGYVSADTGLQRQPDQCILCLRRDETSGCHGGKEFSCENRRQC